MKRLIFIFIFNIVFVAAYSLQPSIDILTWDDFVALMADDSDEEHEPDALLFEELLDIHTHPFNLNNISTDDLHRLPFLSENDIQDILYYIEKHHPLFSTGELMFITSLTREKRQMLQLFCFAGEENKNEFSFNRIFKYSNSELTVRTDVPFYTKAGYKDIADSILQRNPNKKYIGNSLYHSLRYTFNSQNHIFAGLQLEKDPGERYIDHYSVYAMLKNIGCLQTAIVGNYRASFGHGLVINTASSFSKTMKISSLEIIDRGFMPNSSSSESGFLTGAATTLHFGKMKISAFASFKNTDATFNKDSVTISSFKNDGLHRTPLELSKKGNTHQTDFGGNIHFDFNHLQLSITVAATNLDHPLSPHYDTKASHYKYYNPQGKNFCAYSLAYSYRTEKILFSGETALNENRAIATINQLQWTPSATNSFTTIYRYYQAKYHAINSRAFSENSNVSNEQGLYLGWKYIPTRTLTLSSYIDLMYFPWLKYQVYGSSYGLEALTQLTFTPSKVNTFSLRYRIKSKQKDYDVPDDSNISAGTILKYNTSHNLRLQHNLTPTHTCTFKTTLSGIVTTFGRNSSQGISIGETFKYTGINNLSLSFSTTYFNTDDYSTRIYNYEPSLLYTFAMTSYYYNGVRTCLLAKWQPKDNLFLTAKVSSTIYFNRSTIGTDLELIGDSHKEDLYIQLRWKF